MFINSLGVTGVAAAVWGSAVRDLSAPTGSDSAGPARVNVTPNNGSKGAWVQLIAATTAKGYALVFSANIQQTGGTIYFDIGIGGVGVEVAVVKDIPVGMTTNVGVDYFIVVVPCVIPAGTRISVRAQADFAAAAIGVLLTVME